MGTAPPKNLKPRKPHGPRKGSTVYLTDPLTSIYAYVNINEDEVEGALAKDQKGTVTFVTASGRKAYAVLVRCTFPAGTWQATVGKSVENRYVLTDIVCKYPPVVDAGLVERLNGLGELIWGARDEEADKIDAMMAAREGRNLRIVIAYSRAATGNAQTLSESIPLTAGDNKVLKDPALAEMYLQFVEHFGRVPVDFSLADDGLTQAEIEQVEQDRPEIIDITNLFVAGAADFQTAKPNATPPATLMNLQAMLEAIFFQRKVKNDLANRNLLGIGIGKLLVPDASAKLSTKSDIGVLRRTAEGPPGLLLYDRFGSPVMAFGGPLDLEYRSVDLEKIQRDLSIPFFEIKVADRGLYLFLRGLEQQLGTPVREVEALVASLYKHTLFIAEEIYSRYNGQIGERIVAFAPWAIGFFVVHAIASRLLATHPVAFLVYMALMKAAGLVMGLDFALVNMARLQQAGVHFNRMEEIHREKDKAPTLTKLSEHHLTAGAAALIDAMADLIALGVYMAAPFALKTKPGRALIQGLKNAGSATIELITDAYRVIEIKLRKPTTKIEAPVPKSENTGQMGAPPPAQGDPPAQKSIENPNAGVQQEESFGKQPEQKPLQVKRPRALDMSAEELANDVAAQQELFQAAQEACARQNAFIQSVLKELGIQAEGYSILKRPSFDSFIEGVLKKVGGRKKGKYKTIGEMTDMVRGRVNLDDPKLIQKVADAIQARNDIEVHDFRKSRTVVGVQNGYPRYHVDVIDPETGIAHEWQIGTKQITDFYETPGIDVGKLDIQPGSRNIHDVEYDILGSIDEPNPDWAPEVIAKCKKIVSETTVHSLRVEVAEFSSKLGRQNVSAAELESTTKMLHQKIAAVLKEVIKIAGGEPDGIKFVESLKH
jgi:hypothetical protein